MSQFQQKICKTELTPLFYDIPDFSFEVGDISMSLEFWVEAAVVEK